MDDRNAFAERIRLQLASRYRGHTVAVDPVRFAVRLTAPGVDAMLPLSPLHHAVQRDPQRTAALIADFVSGAELHLQPRPGAGFSTSRLLWCVRSRDYLDELSRSDELLTREIAGDLVAFVAESLPGSIMRGVPRSEWLTRSYQDSDVVAAADRATAERFAKVPQRILGGERLTRDGWQYAGDQLFASSLLMVPAVLRAFADRAGGEVLIGVPDRALLLAIPASAPGAEQFARRVLQAYRDAMTPCSRQVLVSDGSNLRIATGLERRRGPSLLAWLND